MQPLIKCLQNDVNFFLHQRLLQKMIRNLFAFLFCRVYLWYETPSCLHCKGLQGQTLSSYEQRKLRVDLAVTQADLSLRCGHMQR